LQLSSLLRIQRERLQAPQTAHARNGIHQRLQGRLGHASEPQPNLKFHLTQSRQQRQLLRQLLRQHPRRLWRLDIA
jgi:hypothetical protein